MWLEVLFSVIFFVLPLIGMFGAIIIRGCEEIRNQPKRVKGLGLIMEGPPVKKCKVGGPPRITLFEKGVRAREGPLDTS